MGDIHTERVVSPAPKSSVTSMINKSENTSSIPHYAQPTFLSDSNTSSSSTATDVIVIDDDFGESSSINSKKNNTNKSNSSNNHDNNNNNSSDITNNTANEMTQEEFLQKFPINRSSFVFATKQEMDETLSTLQYGDLSKRFKWGHRTVCRSHNNFSRLSR
mmetsp:Transcript_32067/g.46215  ORF Transcript_32067/g.46215 Transcript_32067/m.46215 type:complete len:161 (-) Transcript_32067:247-729(-)